MVLGTAYVSLAQYSAITDWQHSNTVLTDCMLCTGMYSVQAQLVYMHIIGMHKHY